MKQAKSSVKDPLQLGIERALRRAARKALELGRRFNTPVYVEENGRLVNLNVKKPAKFRSTVKQTVGKKKNPK